MPPSEFLVTFSSVAEHLHRTGRPFTLSQRGDLLQCRFEEHPVATTVAMRPLTTGGGTEWLAMSTPVCPLERVHLRAALLANAELSIGVLAAWNGLVLLRQTWPLTSLSFAQLEHGLRALVQLAAVLAATAAGVADNPELDARYGYLFR